MKTVSGTVVSRKPVNLSKVANILSNFVTSDNGASQSVSNYLRRTSMAFNELVYFKKHHKFKRNQPKEEAFTKSDISHRHLEEDEVRILENGTLKLKKKEKIKKSEGSLGNVKNDNIEVELEGNYETMKEKCEEKKKKKRKSAEVDEGENGKLATPERKKRRKTRTDE